MTGLTIRNTKDKIVFSIDKNNFTEDDYIQMLKIAKVQYLIKEADFDKSILDLGNELKANWWNEHKNGILTRIGK